MPPAKIVYMSIYIQYKEGFWEHTVNHGCYCHNSSIPYIYTDRLLETMNHRSLGCEYSSVHVEITVLYTVFVYLR
jgi:hypothetical protein